LVEKNERVQGRSIGTFGEIRMQPPQDPTLANSPYRGDLHAYRNSVVLK